MPDNARPYRVTLWMRARRALLYLIFYPIIRIVFRTQVSGRENVPAHGPYVVAYNHISVLEPPLLLAFWPVFLEAVAGADVWERSGQGLLVTFYGAIPIKRGEYDRLVMDRIQAALAAGYPLMISPEGGRSHSPGMRRALPGVAYILDRAGEVPILPAAFSGTSDEILKQAFSRRLPRPRIQLRIGPAFTLPPVTGKGDERRRARQRNADEVMLRIAELLPPEYHGAYAEEMAARRETGVL
ncbi:MAG: 1-acyl-sn-glycerol-3-phosphate acyltransferase [Chloroflexi bacterium]|nr:1-acyl-sn-glycerol-3-phosphate acyltransferase [Chloroflexota bacterium]